jgi:hypothetical protein
MTALLANLEKQATSPQLPPKPGEPTPPQNGVTPNGFTAQQPAPAVA